MSDRLPGTTFQWRFLTVDAAAADQTATACTFCMRRIGDETASFDLDETDTTEVDIVAGYVDVTLSAAQTTNLVAGTYCIQFTWTYAGGTAASEERTERVRQECC